jgi:gluconate kinase
VAVPLLRQKHRDWIHARFPKAVFVLVECDPARWQTRLAGRRHTVGAEYARKVLPLYEPPSLEHTTLDDSAEGAESVRRQLAMILRPTSNKA